MELFKNVQDAVRFLQISSTFFKFLQISSIHPRSQKWQISGEKLLDASISQPMCRTYGGYQDMSRFPQVFGSQSLRQLEKRLVALEVGLLQRGRATRRNHIKSPHQYY